MKTAAEMRRQDFERMAAEPLDLLVVGGGIVGAGVVRDAAMRGLRAGLVEQNDFASGTSSRSSRLLHGGLRYLAQGRLGLVHEASVEKKIIHKIAPHLASPLPFVFPTYRDNKEWPLWQLKIGVKIYDLLCNGRNLGKSTWLDREELLKSIPFLLSENLTGAVRYYDGFTNDARLTLDTLNSASRHGAILLNYCSLAGASRSGIWKCDLADRLGNNRVAVEAKTVVNATGPWADGLPHSHVKLRITKGIHVVVDHPRVPVTDTVVMTEGKRILFAIPWGGRTILGTTDTDFNGPPDEVKTDAEDLQYVLRVTNHFFPNAKLFESDVVSTWAGLRPLLANRNGAPSDVARSHQIRMPEPGWWDVAGGKLTTYRLMAEQATNRVVHWLRRQHQINGSISSCRTDAEPLLKGSGQTAVSGLLPPQFTREIVEHYCAREWARHVDDVMVRRTSWRHYLRDHAERAETVADWMAEMLNWSTEQRTHEMERYSRCQN